MAQAPQNIWNNSWGSQTNRESTPPAGWTWDFGKNYWEYTGIIPTTPTAPTKGTNGDIALRIPLADALSNVPFGIFISLI